MDDSNTAWHSGNKKVNQQSIGIEIVAWKTATGMTTTQEGAVVQLCRFLIDVDDVPLTNVVPHRSIKPTDCPGWLWPMDSDLKTWTAKNLS